MTNSSTTSTASSAPANLSRGRSASIWALLLVGTLLTITACLGVWVERQLTDTNNWTETSAALIRDPAIQRETAAFLSEQVAANPELPELIGGALPPRLQALTPVIVGGLSQATDRLATRALQSEQFQKLWIAANTSAQQQLIAAINQGGDQRAIILDLRPMIGKLAVRAGLGEGAEQAVLAQDRGVIDVIESDQIATLRKAAKALKAIVWINVILALGCFAGAVALARGRRARTLTGVGAGIAGAGLLVMVVRKQLGASLVDTAAGDGGAVAAAEATWRIGTSLLQQAATSLAIIGLIVLLAGLLGTQTGPARTVRRWIAPGVTQQPAIAYGVATFLVVAILAWGPIPATSTWFGALILLACVLGGVAALRGQIMREQPAAGEGEASPPAATA